MESIQRLGLMIEKELLLKRWPSQPENLYDPLDYFLKLGGKRIRPVLSLMAAELFGEKAEKALPSAMCVELFHNFSLIHDDIMDNAPLRRKQVTVHEKWNSNIAILSGDVLLVKAYQEIEKQNRDHIPDLLSLFNRTAVEVCEGQQWDMDFENLDSVQIEQYIEMIRLKTSVLLGCALEMGAIVANANTSDRTKIYRFGQDLGLAFQIKDDLLDLYGDPEKFGKQIGGDVIANKKTLLYLLALQQANSEQIKQFKELESLSDLEYKVKAVRDLFTSLEVPKLAQDFIDRYYQSAMKELMAIEVAEERKNDLSELAVYLMNREN